MRARVFSRFRIPAAPVSSLPRATFSATVKTGTSMKCWCTMPMPGGHGIAGAVELHWLVVNEDLALGGLVEAKKNVHEGRFTGPVFTEQGMDLAGLDDDVDVVVGSEVAESFGDAPKLEFHVCYPFFFSSGPIRAGGCRVEVGPADSTLVKRGLRRNAVEGHNQTRRPDFSHGREKGRNDAFGWLPYCCVSCSSGWKAIRPSRRPKRCRPSAGPARP